MEVKTLNIFTLVESEILQQVQQSFAEKHTIGVVILDEQGFPLTKISDYIAAPAEIRTSFRDLLKIILNDKINVSRYGLLDGKPVLARFLDGAITRIISPIIFQGKILGSVSLIQLQKDVEVHSLVRITQKFNEIPNDEEFLQSILDYHSLSSNDSIITTATQFQSIIHMLLDSGYEQLSPLSTTQGRQDKDIVKVEPVRSPRECSLLSTRAGDIIDCDMNAVAALDCKHPEELIGLNVLQLFVLNRDLRRKIRDNITESGEVNCFPCILKKSNGLSMPVNLRVIPFQNELKKPVGYRYVFEVAHTEKAVFGRDSDLSVPKKKTAYPGNDTHRTKKDKSLNDKINQEKVSLNKQEVREKPSVARDKKREVGKSQFRNNQLGATLVTDTTGMIKHSNYQALKILKLPFQMILNHQITSLFSESDKESILNCLHIAVNNGSASIAVRLVKEETKAKKIKLEAKAVKHNQTIKIFWSLDSEPVYEHAVKDDIDPFVYFSSIDYHWEFLIKSIDDFSNNFQVENKNVHPMQPKKDHNIQRLLNNRDTYLEGTWDLFAENCIRVFQTEKAITDVYTIHFDSLNSKSYKLRHTITPLKKADGMTGIQGYTLDVSQSLSASLPQLDSRHGSTWSTNEYKSDDIVISHGRNMDSATEIIYRLVQNYNHIFSDVPSFQKFLVDNKDQEKSAFLQELSKRLTKVKDINKQLSHYCASFSSDLKAIHLNNLIGNYEKACRHLTTANVKLSLELNADPDLLYGNSEDLKIILRNICQNACEAMPNGGKLFLRTESRKINSVDNPFSNYSSTSHYVILKISDTGIGIKKGIQDVMYEPFTTTKSQGSGKGLGLAAVYGIVKNHKGFIDFQTLEGIGTTFTIYFPSFKKESINMPSSQLHNDETSNKTVLVIDDDPGIIEVSSMALQLKGYKVLTATSAEKGISILKKYADDIDIVILDFLLPDMSGLDCGVKMNKIVPQIPIIISSGLNRNEAISKGLEKMNSNWLQKPFTSSQLVDIVSSTLEKKSE